VFANRKSPDGKPSGKSSEILKKSSIQDWIFRTISSSISSVYFINIHIEESRES